MRYLRVTTDKGEQWVLGWPEAGNMLEFIAEFERRDLADGYVSVLNGAQPAPTHAAPMHPAQSPAFPGHAPQGLAPVPVLPSQRVAAPVQPSALRMMGVPLAAVRPDQVAAEPSSRPSTEPGAASHPSVSREAASGGAKDEEAGVHPDLDATCERLRRRLAEKKMHVDDRCLAILAVLGLGVDDYGCICISQSEIARLSGISIGYMSPQMKVLVSKGLVAVSRPGSAKSPAIYQVLMHAGEDPEAGGSEETLNEHEGQGALE